MARKQKRTGFTAGAFDLTHAGHYLMFKECKQACDHLTVGLHTDPTLDRPEKNKPVQTIKERKIQLEACRYIDKIIIYRTEKELIFLLKKLNPDVRFVGADWKGKKFTGYELPIKVVYNSRNHKFSSTSLRQRVAKAESLRRP